MTPIFEYIHSSGKHYDATFYSYLTEEMQELVVNTIKTALKHKNRAFYVPTEDGNYTHCMFVESKQVLLILIKDPTDKEVIDRFAVLMRTQVTV